jgi:predicted RNA-binding protein (virulence factor B family)
VDCSLQPIGKQAQVSVGEKRILEILKEKGGAVPVTTKSSPEEIEKMFGMSKKMFKATVNPMLVEGRLKVEGGELVVSGEW